MSSLPYARTCPPTLPVSDWYIYLIPSISVYFGVLVLLILQRLLFWSMKSVEKCEKQFVKSSKYLQFINSPIKQWLEACASGLNRTGRIMYLMVFIMSIASFILYLIDASTTASGTPIEYCINWFETPKIQVDFAFNIVFLVHFLFRFGATVNDPLAFWLSWQTVVDVATVPTSVTYLVHNRYWPALRFFRVMYLMIIPELAERAGILTEATHIRLAKLGSQFISLWFVSAGFVHLLENSGDPWLTTFNGQTLAYWQCVYFMIVTGSTVGYGDIACKTVLGQIFDCFYIFFGLAMFASALPEVLNIMQIASPYKGRFRVIDGKKHVIVCGNINTESARKFLENFLHPDWESDMPSLDFEALLKRRTNVFYICGSEMNATDLERAALLEADACIIIANQFADDPDDEDSATIMRAVAIKNLCGRMRILVQLLLQQNESHLNNVPNWGRRDAVVCLDEFKMGLLAANCWAPGFATLLSLLLTQLDEKKDSGDENDAKTVYWRGVAMEIYEIELSPEFDCMTFAEVASLCFERLNILMFAVRSGKKCMLAPGNEFLIRVGDHGFFVADSFESVERAMHYCKNCHQHAQYQDIHRCHCKSNSDDLRSRRTSAKSTDTDQIRLQSLLRNEIRQSPEEDVEANPPKKMREGIPAVPAAVVPKTGIKPRRLPKVTEQIIAEERFDFTGMFYWCKPRKFEEALLSLEEATNRRFENHVVLCVFGDVNSPLIGLRNFVMPLRSSNRHPKELFPIVIVGNASYLVNAWPYIKVFPGIFVINESPMNRSALRACSIEKCRMCVVVGARRKEMDPILVDKQAILCYLNIKSMRFDESDAAMIGKDSPSADKKQTQTSIPSRLPFAASHKDDDEFDEELTAESAAPVIANTVPIIADVILPENVLVLDDDPTHNMSTPLQLTNPFACGTVFAGDVLGNVTCAAYYSPSMLKLVREVVTGGSTNETQRLFAEGIGLIEGTATNGIELKRSRPRISVFTISDAKYEQYGRASCTFAQLFLGILKDFGYVCLGVARLRNADVSGKSPLQSLSGRLVILRPPNGFTLRQDDVILCLKPFNPLKNSTEEESNA